MARAKAATYWNGERCEARRVSVVVADDGFHPDYWAHAFVGERRDAVEVRYAGKTFYIDDEGFDQEPEQVEKLRRWGIVRGHRVGFPGWGWQKVTTARGGPRHGHASLSAEPGSVKKR